MLRQLSSFDVYVITSEFQNLIGSYIDKIYQLSQNEILIRFRNVNTKNKEAFFVRNGQFICLTDKQFETPQKPSTFAMTLRKYLQNGRITGVEQHEFDRIIKLHIGKKQGEFTLVFEFFSDGNIVLVNPDGEIILPLIRQSWAHRKVKGHKEYQPPPSQLNPFELDKKGFKRVLKESNADLVRTLAVNFNLSGVIAEEICFKAYVKKDKKIEDLTDGDITKVFQVFTDFLDIFQRNDFNPVLAKRDDKIVDILPLKFESYHDMDFEEINSFSRGLENFIEIETKAEKKEKVESKADKKMGKLERMLTQQKKKVNELKQKIKKKNLEGELIYLHYQKIKKILDEIGKVLESKEKKLGIEQVNNLDLVKKFSPEENLLVVKLRDTSGNIFDVKLDFRKSVTENAEQAYDDSKKFKSKLRGAEKAIEKTLDKIKKAQKEKHAEEKKQSVEKTSSRFIQKKKKTFWFEKYRWFISSDGNIVVGGRDASSNDQVVKKYLKDRDRYAHADISGAPSIVIKSKNVKDEKVEISENTLREACIFAACFSKAWKQFAEARAYWVLPEQVSKTPQSGEFVPRGAFIVRGKRNYLNVKLEVAVGKIEIEGAKKVMCGPISAVKEKTDRYIVLEPGNIKKSDIVNKIARVFDSKPETVSQVLPPGSGKIIDSKGVKL